MGFVLWNGSLNVGYQRDVAGRPAEGEGDEDASALDVKLFKDPCAKKQRAEIHTCHTLLELVVLSDYIL